MVSSDIQDIYLKNTPVSLTSLRNRMKQDLEANKQSVIAFCRTACFGAPANAVKRCVGAGYIHRYRYGTEQKGVHSTGMERVATNHIGYIVSGDMIIQDSEGFEVMPGHDTWVLGDEPCVVFTAFNGTHKTPMWPG